ncbi:MAG: hypothetical protein HY901_07915 [Deltaproteobacteria bacterium]|nr:hypothetical protein [Deltaproteobacteria bacterium]
MSSLHHPRARWGLVSDLMLFVGWLGVVLLIAVLVDVFKARRLRAMRRRSVSREALLALSPVQLIETFDLQRMDKAGVLLWMSAVDLDQEQRRKVYGELGQRWGVDVDLKEVELEVLPPEPTAEGGVGR